MNFTPAAHTAFAMIEELGFDIKHVKRVVISPEFLVVVEGNKDGVFETTHRLAMRNPTEEAPVE